MLNSRSRGSLLSGVIPLSCTIFSFSLRRIFCIFIIYDTYLITSKLGYDDYIIAAIELYLDIVNLFLFLLSLLSSKN